MAEHETVDDPDSRPHPNDERYEMCGSCGNAYKLRGTACPCGSDEPAPAAP